MPYVVDGDNLLGTWPARDRGDADKRRLSFELARFGRAARRRVVTVFDGPRPAGAGFGPGTRFSGPRRSADEAILDLLRGEREPRGWLVVTSDRALADRCRHLGARTERSDRFRKRLLPGPGDEKPEREDDLDYWLERFGAAEEE